MPIALIAAAAGKALTIGKDNDMPWHFTADLKFFKEKTLGHDVLMGRKTYESILKRLGKPLPGRRTIVLTRDKSFTDDRATIIHDIERITALADNKTLFVIGGAEIYRQTIALADTLYITHIDQDFEGDAFFPAISETQWQLENQTMLIEKKVKLRFSTYQRMAKLSN